MCFLNAIRFILRDAAAAITTGRFDGRILACFGGYFSQVDGDKPFAISPGVSSCFILSRCFSVQQAIYLMVRHRRYDAWLTPSDRILLMPNIFECRRQ